MVLYTQYKRAFLVMVLDNGAKNLTPLINRYQA